MPTAASDAPGHPRSSPARKGMLAMPRDMAKVVRLVWRSSRRLTSVFFGLTAIVALLPPAIAWVGKCIIDAVVAGQRKDTIRWILVECVIVVLLASARQLLNLARTMLDSRLGIDVHLLLLQRANSMELRHFEDSNFYDQLERARREASSRPIAVVTRMFDLLENGMRLLGYASLLLAFGPLAVLGLLLAALPATIAEARYSRAEFKVRNARSTDWRRLHYLEHTLTTEWHAKEIRLFGLGPLLLDRYRQQAERLHQERVRMATRRSIVTHALSMLATAALYAAYVAIGLMAVAGSISVGTLTMYLASLHNVQQCFQAILQGISRIYEHNLYMSNLFSFLERSLSDDEPAPQSTDTPAPSHDGPSTAALGASGTNERGLRLEHVSFRYPDKAQWVLQDLCLHIPHGQRVALVGHNGAGKTTLIKLITGLYKPSAGRVLLDGRDVRAYDKDELRARFGVVFQDYNRYHLTLQENVGVGSIEHLSDRDQVMAAMAEGGAQNLVAKLEQGLDTQLGSRFTRGVELSGGQWQSVALARGFMRTEADVLVLDEPSAALDAESEHRVFERFQALSRGRTTIIVSHRFPTVRLAERILVLENGGITEDGTHDELLERDRSYARFFRLQAAGYN